MQAFIGLGLSIGKVAQSHTDYGSVWGVNTSNNTPTATWNVFVALGTFAFAFNVVSRSSPCGVSKFP